MKTKTPRIKSTGEGPATIIDVKDKSRNPPVEAVAANSSEARVMGKNKGAESRGGTSESSLRIARLKEVGTGIKPLDPREYPLARDSRGSARREELRQKTHMVSPPRQSRRPQERSRQAR